MCSGTCNCPGMLVLVCVCTCVHVHLRASSSLSLCVCLRPALLVPPHPDFSESCIADSLQAGWPAICFLLFLTMRTQEHREPLQLKHFFGLHGDEGCFSVMRAAASEGPQLPVDLAAEQSTAKPSGRCLREAAAHLCAVK